MKPTQRDSYESLWNALHEIELAAVFLPTFEVTHDGGIEAVTKNIVDAIKKAVVALERGGAGGGEPSRDMPHGWVTNWPAPNGGTRPVYHASAIKPKYGPELDNSLVSYPVFTRPGSSPTDLRAEYLRGLEAAAVMVEEWNSNEEYVRVLAEHIRALKGKQ